MRVESSFRLENFVKSATEFRSEHSLRKRDGMCEQRETGQ